MGKKFKALSTTEENARANKTLLRGTCFITKVPLSNKPYELVWHAGAKSYVFIDKKFTVKGQRKNFDELKKE